MSKEPENKPGTTVAMPSELVSLMYKMFERLERYESGDPADMQLERMRANRSPAGWDKPIVKDCLDPDTKVTFDAVLNGRKDGLVFEIVNVRMPEGAETWVKYGGIVPDGIKVHSAAEHGDLKLKEDGTSEEIRFAAAEGNYTQEYKMWRYAALLQPTRVRVIGKALPEYIRPRKVA